MRQVHNGRNSYQILSYHRCCNLFLWQHESCHISCTFANIDHIVHCPNIDRKPLCLRCQAWNEHKRLKSRPKAFKIVQCIRRVSVHSLYIPQNRSIASNQTQNKHDPSAICSPRLYIPRHLSYTIVCVAKLQMSTTCSKSSIIRDDLIYVYQRVSLLSLLTLLQCGLRARCWWVSVHAWDGCCMIILIFLYFDTRTHHFSQEPPFRSIVRGCFRCSTDGINY